MIKYIINYLPNRQPSVVEVECELSNKDFNLKDGEFRAKITKPQKFAGECIISWALFDNAHEAIFQAHKNIAFDFKNKRFKNTFIQKISCLNEQPDIFVNFFKREITDQEFSELNKIISNIEVTNLEKIK